MHKKNTTFFNSYYELLSNAINVIDNDLLFDMALKIRDTGEKSGKVIIIGNGGSAAIASHISVDLTKVASIRSTNFNEAGLLTCFSNDYGYEHWAEKAIEFYADKDDLIILISSSGQSDNIINGAIKARDMGVSLITLSGFKESNPLKKMGDINLWVDSTNYNIVETTHQVWLLSVVDYLIESNQNRGN